MQSRQPVQSTLLGGSFQSVSGSSEPKDRRQTTQVQSQACQRLHLSVPKAQQWDRTATRSRNRRTAQNCSNHNKARKRRQRPPDKIVDRPVDSPTNARGSQSGNSRFGSIITGHHHSAEPMTLRTTKSISFRIELLRRKIADTRSNSEGFLYRFGRMVDHSVLGKNLSRPTHRPNLSHQRVHLTPVSTPFPKQIS